MKFKKRSFSESSDGKGSNVKSFRRDQSDSDSDENSLERKDTSHKVSYLNKSSSDEETRPKFLDVLNKNDAENSSKIKYTEDDDSDDQIGQKEEDQVDGKDSSPRQEIDYDLISHRDCQEESKEQDDSSPIPNGKPIFL